MSTDRAPRGWADLHLYGGTGANVLVVDDEEPVRRTLERLVTKLGHQVKMAASAEEADSWLGAMRFDVMLLDIQLPRMTGVEFLRWALSRDPELAVIMLTGIDDPGTAIECLEHGARTYLVKPVEAAFLGIALRDAIAMRRILVERNELSRGG
ncbi:MAG: response regulator [Gemmatimonadetes bacterium]|nr:response regulator [Gemmatimonadota bacterium]